MFESLPGFFVEHDDDFVGTCLPQPTPCPVEVVNGGPIMDPSKSKEDIRNFFKTANKENDIKMVSPVSPEKYVYSSFLSVLNDTLTLYYF